MIKVAFVNVSTGEVESVRTVGADSQYVDGQTYGGAMAKHIAADSDERFIVNKYWDSGAFVDKPEKPSRFHLWGNGQWNLELDKLMDFVREQRNQLLSSTDWTQMPDAPLSDSKKAEWATYRQALRDLPASVENITSLDQVVWPTKPS